MERVAALASLLALAGGLRPATASDGEGAGRVRITGRVEAYGVVRFDHASPSQDPLARIDLAAEQRVLPGWRWRLSAIGLEGGPPKDASAGMFDLRHSFQNLSPSLELDEAYLDHTGSDVRLRIGKQKFFWGRLDGVQPNDLLNPRQYEDPFLTDERDLKIAVPSLSATWLFPASWRAHLPEESLLTLVWQPYAVPWRYPLQAERWFAPTALLPTTFTLGAMPGTPCPCDVSVAQETRNASAPARQLDNGNLGVRLSARLARTDVAVVYFDGYDPTPSFLVAARLASTEPTGAAIAADADLLPAYRRFRSIGADAATPIGPFTARAEAAWRFRRPFPFALDDPASRLASDPRAIQSLLAGETVEFPAYVERDAVEWGIGADTIIDGFVPLLELYQIVLLHNDQRLLVRDVDTRLTANLSRSWMADRLETELVALWGIEAGYELLRAQVEVDVHDGVRVAAGVLGIWGDRDSLVGQYRRNGEAYARIRYTF